MKKGGIVGEQEYVRDVKEENMSRKVGYASKRMSFVCGVWEEEV